MSRRIVNIRRFKRGARWETGEPRMCTRCGWEQRSQRRRAVITAELVNGRRGRVPVAYCPEHIPEELR